MIVQSQNVVTTRMKKSMTSLSTNNFSSFHGQIISSFILYPQSFHSIKTIHKLWCKTFIKKIGVQLTEK